MSAPVLTGLRLSELARCPRQCALRGLNAEPAERTVRERRWLARGRMFGWYAYEQFKERYGPEDVERERSIDWGLGIGHADLYIRSQKLLIEVVSSTSPDSIFATKARQVKQYLHFDPEAEKAAVYVIDPSTLDREDLYPVVLHQADIDEIEEDIRSVEAALTGGPLPECCAASPSECRNSMFCPFTAQAWEGWEPPQAVDLSDDEAAVELARQLYLVKTRRQRRGGDDKTDDELQKQVQAQLVERGLLPGLDYLLNGLKLRRTQVDGRETFSRSKAAAAGVWTEGDDERFRDFLKLGDGYDTFSVRLLERERPPVEADEYDEVPF